MQLIYSRYPFSILMLQGKEMLYIQTNIDSISKTENTITKCRMIKNMHTHQINKCAEIRLRWYMSNYVYDKSYHHYLTEYSLCTDFPLNATNMILKILVIQVPKMFIANLFITDKK